MSPCIPPQSQKVQQKSRDQLHDLDSSLSMKKRSNLERTRDSCWMSITQEMVMIVSARKIHSIIVVRVGPLVMTAKGRAIVKEATREVIETAGGEDIIVDLAHHVMMKMTRRVGIEAGDIAVDHAHLVVMVSLISMMTRRLVIAHIAITIVSEIARTETKIAKEMRNIATGTTIVIANTNHHVVNMIVIASKKGHVLHEHPKTMWSKRP
jgi:hypothetical protein